MAHSFSTDSICVLYKLTQGGDRIGIGTGFFFLENNLVATSKHILEDHASTQVPYVLIVRPSQLSEGCTPFECSYHTEQDLALIKLARPYPVVPLRPCVKTENGFIYVGYDPPTNSLIVEHVSAFYTPAPWEGKHSTMYFFEWDGAINPGHSGGPLIGSDGGVAGMLMGVSRQVECSDDTHVTKGRARAVFTGPLMDVYGRLRYDPASIPLLDVPFVEGSRLDR
jgi:Trypsin-like peptidase domain